MLVESALSIEKSTTPVFPPNEEQEQDPTTILLHQGHHSSYDHLDGGGTRQEEITDASTAATKEAVTHTNTATGNGAAKMEAMVMNQDNADDDEEEEKPTTAVTTTHQQHDDDDDEAAQAADSFGETKSANHHQEQPQATKMADENSIPTLDDWFPPNETPPDEAEDLDTSAAGHAEMIANYMQARTAGSPFFQAHPSPSLPVFETNGKSIVAVYVFVCICFCFGGPILCVHVHE